jgi:hypothetical protein
VRSKLIGSCICASIRKRVASALCIIACSFQGADASSFDYRETVIPLTANIPQGRLGSANVSHVHIRRSAPTPRPPLPSPVPCPRPFLFLAGWGVRSGRRINRAINLPEDSRAITSRTDGGGRRRGRTGGCPGVPLTRGKYAGVILRRRSPDGETKSSAGDALRRNYI